MEVEFTRKTAKQNSQPQKRVANQMMFFKNFEKATYKSINILPEIVGAGDPCGVSLNFSICQRVDFYLADVYLAAIVSSVLTYQW